MQDADFEAAEDIARAQYDILGLYCHRFVTDGDLRTQTATMNNRVSQQHEIDRIPCISHSTKCLSGALIRCEGHEAVVDTDNWKKVQGDGKGSDDDGGWKTESLLS